MYDTILVPHAGTPAKSNSSKIIILHVVEEMPHVPLLSLHSSQMAKVRKQLSEITRALKDQMSDEISKKAKLCEKEGISSHVKITTGLPEDEIMKIVKNQKIDLIVMAKRRKLKGVKKLLSLGSVSRKILESVSCPVLMLDIEKK
jgi:nucleotide-binding universal stress UspA family protein